MISRNGRARGRERPAGYRLAGGWPVAAGTVTFALIFLAGTRSIAEAETLREALGAAYGSNPKLEAERARLRATDEDVARAESGFRPIVEGSAEWGRETITTKPNSTSSGEANPWGYSISVRQSVFSGWRTTSQVSEAEATVKAGRETLRQVETEVLLDAVTAYMDVVTASADPAYSRQQRRRPQQGSRSGPDAALGQGGDANGRGTGRSPPGPRRLDRRPCKIRS